MPDKWDRHNINAEFARRLAARMQDKGWNQSELARAAAKFMPNKKLRRDNISVYISGRQGKHSAPGPTILNALSKALGCKPTDLYPEHSLTTATKETVGTIELTSGGKVWIRLSAETTQEKAMQIMSMLKEEDNHI